MRCRQNTYQTLLVMIGLRIEHRVLWAIGEEKVARKYAGPCSGVSSGFQRQPARRLD